MKRIAVSLAGACLLWAAPPTLAQEFRDTRLQRIDDPLRVQFPRTEPARSDETMRATIRTAATVKGWRIESDTPSRMELTLLVRDKHKARIEVTYLGAGYVVRYLGSEELLYDSNAAGSKGPARAIHANYNLWVRELAQTVNAGLGTAALIEVPPAFAGAAPVAATAAAGSGGSGPAGEGMPVPGTQWKYGYTDRQYGRGVQFFTVEVAGVEGTRVHERVAVEGGAVFEAVVDVAKVAFVNRQIGPGTSFAELAPYPQDLQKTSQPPAGYPSANNAMWKISAPKYTEEEVRVPAGTFKALRVEVTGTSSGFGGSYALGASRFVYVAWYSRELNRYVQIQHQAWNRQNARVGDEYVQLVGYRPGR